MSLALGEHQTLECPDRGGDQVKWCAIKSDGVAHIESNDSNYMPHTIQVNGSDECPDFGPILTEESVLPVCNNMLLFCIYNRPFCDASTIQSMMKNPYYIQINNPACPTTFPTNITYPTCPLAIEIESSGIGSKTSCSKDIIDKCCTCTGEYTCTCNSASNPATPHKLTMLLLTILIAMAITGGGINWT